MLKHKLSDQNKIDIVNKFQTGLRICDLAAEYNVTGPNITALLKRRGIITRGKRVHKLNEHIFDDIETEEQAYWLGFIAADGNVFKTTLSICLHEKDKEHLKKFQQFMQSDLPMDYRVKPPSWRMRCNSVHICDSLIKYNITPAKSFSILPPTLPDTLIKHYYRGFFDGDGWVSYYAKRNNWQIGAVSANKHFLEQMRLWIYLKTNLCGSLYQKTSSVVYQLMYSGTNIARNVMECLYYNATIYLDRKYEKYNILKHTYGPERLGGIITTIS